MDDVRLNEVLGRLPGDDPSPEFVARLRTQVEAELDDAVRGGNVVVLEPALGDRDARKRSRLHVAVAAAAAAVILVALAVIAMLRDGDGTNEPIITDRPTPSSAPAEVTPAPLPPDPAPEPTALPTEDEGAVGWSLQATADGLPGTDVIAVDVNHDGTTWAMVAVDRQELDLGYAVRTAPGRISLARWDGQSWEQFDPPAPVEGDLSLAAGPSGTAWLVGGRWQSATPDGIWNELDLGSQGLWYFDGSDWTTLYEGRPDDTQVRPMVGDVGPDGTLWAIGREPGDDPSYLLGQVLARWADDGWEIVDSPVQPEVTGFGADEHNLFVTGDSAVELFGVGGVAGAAPTTYQIRLARLTGETWVEEAGGPYDGPPPRPVGRTGHLARAADGSRLWVTVEDGQSGDALLTDSRTPIGFAVAEFDGTTWTGEREGTDFEFVGEIITPIHVAADASHLYLSGFNELRRIDRDTLTEDTESMAPVPLEVDLTGIRSLTVDEGGVLWIAVDGGVVRYRPEAS